MARYYFDSSALIKYYRNEPGSPEVQRMLADRGSAHLISRLTLTEILSGLAKNVRMGFLADSEYLPLLHRLRADVKHRLVRPMRMLNVQFRTAGDLIAKHGMTRQLRTLDAIQLAVALHFHQASPLDGFVCADQRLCDVAALEGLCVINPERPEHP